MGIFHSLQERFEGKHGLPIPNPTITIDEFYHYFDKSGDEIVTWEEFNCSQNGLGCQGLGYGYA